MANRPTAEEQLGRILQLLPLATREEGVDLASLGERLGVSESQIVRDLGEVIGRSFYRPAGSPDDVTVMIEPDRVEVWSASEFRRPTRLNRREAIALGLALRMLEAAEGEESGRAAKRTEAAAEQAGSPEATSTGGAASAASGSAVETASRTATGAALAGKLEERLLSPAAMPASPARIEIAMGAIAPSGIHDTLTSAARDGRRCRILYLRSGAPEPESREIDPYAVLIAAGRWYAIGRCHARRDVRVFRIDRILDAERLADSFLVPPDFDPNDYVSEGRVYRSDEFVEVVVRYSARIARWIAEQGPTEPLADGGALVRYSVADPRWVVRHVLEHAPHAEVVSPPGVRAMVRATALALSAADG